MQIFSVEMLDMHWNVNVEMFIPAKQISRFVLIFTFSRKGTQSHLSTKDKRVLSAWIWAVFYSKYFYCPLSKFKIH